MPTELTSIDAYRNKWDVKCFQVIKKFIYISTNWVVWGVDTGWPWASKKGCSQVIGFSSPGQIPLKCKICTWVKFDLNYCGITSSKFYPYHVSNEVGMKMWIPHQTYQRHFLRFHWYQFYFWKYFFQSVDNVQEGVWPPSRQTTKARWKLRMFSSNKSSLLWLVLQKKVDIHASTKR